MIPIGQCPACDRDARSARTVHRRERDALVRCPHCQSLFSNPRYTPDELEELYRQEYYDEAVAGDQPRWAAQENADVLHRTTLKILRKRYANLRGSGRRVLDYGCGLGFFLAAARAVGFAPFGIELSQVAATHARETLGLDVSTIADDPLASVSDGTFDLVTAWAVIEHVIEPRRVLEQLVGKLKPGGVLAISLPSLSCWRYRIEGGKWFNIVNPTHLTFFSLAAIRTRLGELGLRDPVRAIYWGGRPGFGPVRNALQYAIRVMNLGSEFRIFAQKPGP